VSFAAVYRGWVVRFAAPNSWPGASGARVHAVDGDDDLLVRLLAEEDELQFAAFTNDTAWELGQALVAAARRDRLPVTVDIRRGEQQLFHYALPGTAADNDGWIERKNRVVRRLGHSSFYVGVREGEAFAEKFLLDPTLFAAHGGAFPVIVRDVGVVGTVTVSGLPQEEDHRLVVSVLRAFLAEAEPAQGRRRNGG
jgi:uncharacterized protein (UPF0303 family)